MSIMINANRQKTSVYPQGKYESMVFQKPFYYLESDAWLDGSTTDVKGLLYPSTGVDSTVATATNSHFTSNIAPLYTAWDRTLPNNGVAKFIGQDYFNSIVKLKKASYRTVITDTTDVGTHSISGTYALRGKPPVRKGKYLVYPASRNSDSHVGIYMYNSETNTGTFSTTSLLSTSGGVQFRYTSNDKIVFLFRENTTNDLKLICGTVSGGTVTWGTAVTVSIAGSSSNDTYDIQNVSYLTSTEQTALDAGTTGLLEINTDTFVFAYYNNSTTLNYVQACTVSGTTITLGTRVQLSGTASASLTGGLTFAIVKHSTTVFAITYYNYDGSLFRYKLRGASLSGTTITLGTAIDAPASTPGNAVAQCLVSVGSSAGFITNQDTASIGRSYTISGTTITSTGNTATLTVGGANLFASQIYFLDATTFVISGNVSTAYYGKFSLNSSGVWTTTHAATTSGLQCLWEITSTYMVGLRGTSYAKIDFSGTQAILTESETIPTEAGVGFVNYENCTAWESSTPGVWYTMGNTGGIDSYTRKRKEITLDIQVGSETAQTNQVQGFFGNVTHEKIAGDKLYLKLTNTSGYTIGINLYNILTQVQ